MIFKISILLLFTCIGFSAELISQQEEDLNFLQYDPLVGEEDRYLDVFYDYAGTNNERLAIIAIQRLINQFLQDNDYKSAIAYLEEFRIDFTSYVYVIDDMIRILKDKDYNINEVNLGNNINTQYSEYSPILNAEEDRIYFTSFQREGYSDTEDVFVSEYSDGVWQSAEPLSDKINTLDNNEAPQCITTDDNTIVIFGNYPQGLGKGDLFYSERSSDGKFGDIQHYPPPINSEHFDCDGKILNNGQAMMFVSDRPGAIGEFHPYGEFYEGSMQGNTDIYITFKSDTGWSEPINLGATINTPYAERKPFLHPDGVTLYFSSEGHSGLGRMDLFMSKRLNEDSWTEWSEPINMGKEINSAKDERGIIVNTFGVSAYIATAERKITFGGSDIFRFDVPKHLRPEPVVMVKGKVTDYQGNPLEADVLWEDFRKRKLIGEMKSNPLTGEYSIIFPVGAKYRYFASKEGYFPLYKSLDITDRKDTMLIYQDLVLYTEDDIVPEDLIAENQYLDEDAIKLAGEGLFEDLTQWTCCYVIINSLPSKNDADKLLNELDKNHFEDLRIVPFYSEIEEITYFRVATQCIESYNSFKEFKYRLVEYNAISNNKLLPSIKCE